LVHGGDPVGSPPWLPERLPLCTPRGVRGGSRGTPDRSGLARRPRTAPPGGPPGVRPHGAQRAAAL